MANRCSWPLTRADLRDALSRGKRRLNAKIHACDYDLVHAWDAFQRIEAI
ncbi:hypothetical protein M0R72_19195 [Candidatus Pacearchaeota archaeon]|jgi:hypothetical protein|nr:hypothetical protein [Candidatus Pacearchaeota archaeon]